MPCSSSSRSSATSNDPHPRWAILGGLSIGYLLTTKEISFIVLFVFALFLGVAIALRVAPLLLAVGATAVVSFFITSRLLHAFGAPALPGIPWDQPTGPQIQHFIIQLIEHPVVIAGIAITMLSVVVAAWMLDQRRRRDRGWVDGVLGDAPSEIDRCGAARTVERASRALDRSSSGRSPSSRSSTRPSSPTWLGSPAAHSARSATGSASRAFNAGKNPGSIICCFCHNTNSWRCLFFRWHRSRIVWRLCNAWRYRIPLGPRTFVRGFLLVLDTRHARRSSRGLARRCHGTSSTSRCP